MSPSLALAYFFWTRHRRGLTVVGGYWFAVMIFCLVVPAGYFNFAGDEMRWPALAVYALLCSGLIAAIGYLIVVFTFGRETHLEVCDSGFPARMWTLPLRSRTLTVWPMLWGSAAMIQGWATLTWAVCRPCGLEMPLVWPGLLLAVLLAWWQAILWTPFPMPTARLFLLIPASIVLFIAPATASALGAPSAVVCGLLAILLLAAYGTALRGVARSRCGDSVRWGWPAWLRWPWAARTFRPFASAAQAQLWFEWRLHGLAFPVTAASIAVITLPMFALSANNFDAANGRTASPLLQLEPGSLGWAVVNVMVLIPLWAALCIGPQMGRMGGKSVRLTSFLATRPVTEAMLVRAKFAMAAWSVLAGWSVLAVGLLLWLALGGHVPEMAKQFEAVRQRHGPGLFWGWLIFLAVAAAALTWMQMVQRIWVGMTGSPRLIASSVCGFIAAFLGLLLFGSWLALQPDYWPIVNRLLPWLAGAAVFLKTLAAAWSLHALRRRRLIPSAVLWGMPAIWLAVAAGVFAALYALLPDNWFSVPGVVLGIVLLLPLTRLALAPLALSWNRHR